MSKKLKTRATGWGSELRIPRLGEVVKDGSYPRTRVVCPDGQIRTARLRQGVNKNTETQKATVQVLGREVSGRVVGQKYFMPNAKSVNYEMFAVSL